ncbi:MAG: anti-sigma factor family protein [Pyrinomonadaceae bacterium]
MTKEQINIINCTQFEELLTDYLDRTLDASINKAVGAHAMSCPLCHTLLNDVKESLQACRTISHTELPVAPMTRLEARVLAMTAPETAMLCEDFESYLTDYLDGFLPAQSFHRWERHAALCTKCEDLPGMVVRSIGACLTYKTEELTVPAGLHERILNATLGTENAGEITASWTARASDWVRGLRFPIGIPQLAPVAMMILFAFLVFSQTVSADGSLSGVYKQGVQLAETTYQQSADALKGEPVATDTTTTTPTN